MKSRQRLIRWRPGPSGHGLADRGRDLQQDMNQGAAAEALEQQLLLLRPEIEATIRREQQLLET